MSDYRGIAAVTQALRFLLKDKGEGGLAAADITALSPDKAKDADDGEKKLNLFLYHVTPNAAFRNQPFIPSPTLENQPHPLALTLHYLVTAYGKEDTSDTEAPGSHELLGDAMRVFHDTPCLSPTYIEAALGASVFKEQLENVRITWNPLTADEMSKLWGSFQVPYRLSAAYEVSVALIKSNKVAAAAPPVLNRASDAVTSWTSLDSLTILAPGETADSPLTRRSAVEVSDAVGATGGVLLLRGTVLTPACKVRIKSPDGTAEGTITTLPDSFVTLLPDGRMSVQLPTPAEVAWAAQPGIHGVCLLVPIPGATDPEETNLLPFAVAPKIAVTPASVSVAGSPDLTLTLGLPLKANQKVVCLLGSVPLTPAAFSDGATTLTVPVPSNLKFTGQSFPVKKVVRLRVDGADTQPMRRNPLKPTELEFDPAQQVEVTA